MNYICFAVSLRGVDATQRFKQVSNISDIKTEKKGNEDGFSNNILNNSI